jgi:hypothetical protein
MIWLAVLSGPPCDWSVRLPWLGARDQVKWSLSDQARKYHSEVPTSTADIQYPAVSVVPDVWQQALRSGRMHMRSRYGGTVSDYLWGILMGVGKGRAEVGAVDSRHCIADTLRGNEAGAEKV